MKLIHGDFWPDRDQTCHCVAYKTEGADKALRHCKKRDLVIQAGGNVGVWPRYLATKFQRVLTFEPSQENFELMVQNLKNIEIEMFQAALGDKAGACDVWVNKTNCGDDQTRPGTSVVVMAIDDLNVDPDLIYLDIQGDELPVLKGAEKTIERCSPVIAVEIDGHSMTRHGDPRPFLLERGYKQVERVHQDHIFARE